MKCTPTQHRQNRINSTSQKVSLMQRLVCVQTALNERWGNGWLSEMVARDYLLQDKMISILSFDRAVRDEGSFKSGWRYFLGGTSSLPLLCFMVFWGGWRRVLWRCISVRSWLCWGLTMPPPCASEISLVTVSLWVMDTGFLSQVLFIWCPRGSTGGLHFGAAHSGRLVSVSCFEVLPFEVRSSTSMVSTNSCTKRAFSALCSSDFSLSDSEASASSSLL